MEDVVLYDKVRKFFLRGLSVQDIKHELGKKYSSKKIDDAIKEFFKDESTDYDDKLIQVIERRFRKGEFLEHIMADLIKGGHKPFEVEKAIIRSETQDGSPIRNHIKRYKLYTKIHIGLILATIILALFQPMYILGTVIVIIGMMIAHFNVPQKNKYWRTEVEAAPVIGYYINSQYFLRVGNVTMFKFWILEPGFVIFAFFTLLGVYGGMIIHDILFGLICIGFGIIGYISFFFKPSEEMSKEKLENNIKKYEKKRLITFFF